MYEIWPKWEKTQAGRPHLGQPAKHLHYVCPVFGTRAKRHVCKASKPRIAGWVDQMDRKA